MNDNELMLQLDADYKRMISIAEWILYWNKCNIHELQGAIKELQTLCNKWEYDLSRFIKIENLPSNYIPSMVTTYPIWAMDNFGGCLVGNDLSDIEQIEDILRDHFRSD